MSIPDSALKGILKLCKQINAQLGAAAGDTLHADVAAATVDLAAIQALIGTADGTDLAEDLVEIYDEAVAL